MRRGHPRSTPGRAPRRGGRRAPVTLGLAALALVAAPAAWAQPPPAQFHIGVYYGGLWTDAPLQHGEVRTQQVQDGVVVSDTTQRDDPGQVNSQVDSDLDIQELGGSLEWTSPTLLTVGTLPFGLDVYLAGGVANVTNTLKQRSTGAELSFEGDGPFLAGGIAPRMEVAPGIWATVSFDAGGSVGSYDATRSPALASAPLRTRGVRQETAVREDPKVSYVRWRVAMSASKYFDLDYAWLRRLTLRAGVGWEDVSYTLENRVTRPGVQGVTVVQTGETERADSGVFGTVGLSATFRRWLAAHSDFRYSGDGWGVTVRALFGF